MLRIHEKLHSQSGESLVETLTAILIIAVIVAFLSVSITTASRLNAKLNSTPLGILYSEEEALGTATIIAGNEADSNTTNSDIMESKTVDVYKTSGYMDSTNNSNEEPYSYYYYRTQKTG